MDKTLANMRISKRDPRGPGASWINPALTVADCNKSLEFYEKAFGFEKVGAVPDGAGNIVHAAMKYRDIMIMMGPQNAQASPMKTPNNSKVECPISLYVYVEDVDEAFTRAKKAGAEVVQHPEDMFWGDRVCRMKDIDGYEWWLAKNFAEFDPAKMPK